MHTAKILTDQAPPKSYTYHYFHRLLNHPSFRGTVETAKRSGIRLTVVSLCNSTEVPIQALHPGVCITQNCEVFFSLIVRLLETAPSVSYYAIQRPKIVREMMKCARTTAFSYATRDDALYKSDRVPVRHCRCRRSARTHLCQPDQPTSRTRQERAALPAQDDDGSNSTTDLVTAIGTTDASVFSASSALLPGTNP